MDNIFLSPETTIDLSIKTTIDNSGGFRIARFEIVDGGPYQIRTATGREYARIQKAYVKQDEDAAFDLIRLFLVKGVDQDKFGQLHPDIVWTILAEVLKRSRVSETEQGK